PRPGRRQRARRETVPTRSRRRSHVSTTATGVWSSRSSTRCSSWNSARTKKSALRAVQDLELGEPVETPGAVLDAEAARLGAAEGLVGRQGQMSVDPRRAALEA